ncbi:cobyrinate a,c-diamide synthase [Acidobacteriota bacterium]
MQVTRPRVVIAGAAGDSGKTLVTLGLILAFKERGFSVTPFKKGPDYIDAAWLSWAAGVPARNLDTYMMGPEVCCSSFMRHSGGADLAVVEGNRGLFDGFIGGTHSTAELAKLIKAPVILVLPVAKVTRTAAVAVLGFLKMDRGVNLAGVILNRVAGKRHETTVREAIKEITNIPVLGALPRQPDERTLPGRHLGLVTPQEHPEKEGLAQTIARIVTSHVDLDALTDVMDRAPVLDDAFGGDGGEPERSTGEVRVGYFRDSAFTFYYEDNLEALEREGAELVPISSLSDRELPELDSMYMGGGFPETHGDILAKNRNMLESVRQAAEGGLPIYAECGGLIYLARTMEIRGRQHAMAGVLPIDVIVEKRPQGHGYAEVEVDRETPFFEMGTVFRGHEFHYSRVRNADEGTATGFRVLRGTGCFDGRDGILNRNVFAGYTHIHAGGSPEWARSILRAARSYHRQKGKSRG